MNPPELLSPYEPAQYRLRLQGRVGVDWSDWLENVEIRFSESTEGVETLVTGIVRDHAALFGLISHVRDLGMILIGVELIQKVNKGEDE